MKIRLTKLFCEIDDFYRTFKQSIPNHLLTASPRINFPWTASPCTLSPSEMMTLVVAFHLSNYRTFKHFYQHVQRYWRAEFPGLVSYPRFVALQPYLLVPLCLYPALLRSVINYCIITQFLKYFEVSACLAKSSSGLSRTDLSR
jgi:hypothetical protein